MLRTTNEFGQSVGFTLTEESADGMGATVFKQYGEFPGTTDFGHYDGAYESSLTANFSEPVATPEPVTPTLLGTGFAGIAAARRRARSTLRT